MPSSDLPSRAPSQRLAARTKNRPQPADLYPGLNDFSDALEALPLEITRHFTLLREIDAKCIVTTPLLSTLIKRFLLLPLPSSMDEKGVSTIEIPRLVVDLSAMPPLETLGLFPELAEPSQDTSPKTVSKLQLEDEREQVLAQIRSLVRELMPCLEEKMHVAGVAADAIQNHLDRLDYDYELITSNEIPESVQYGPANHPAFISDSKTQDNSNKGAQSTRSESRREAMAAKKAAAAAAAVGNQGSGTEGNEKTRPGTPSSRSKQQQANGTANSNSNSNLNATQNSTGSRNNTNSKTGGNGQKRRKVTGSGNSTGSGNTAVTANAGGAVGNIGGIAGTAIGAGSNATSTPSLSSQTSTFQATGDSERAITSQYQAYTAANQPTFSTVYEAPVAKYATEYNDSDKGGDADSASSRPGTPNGRRNRKARRPSGMNANKSEDAEEPVYCYCSQVSYGEMVGCDGPDCKREWFHLPCIGLTSPPKGRWFCEECAAKYKKRVR